MTSIRDFTPEDIPALKRAIDSDTFHKGEWQVWHFQIKGVPTKVVDDRKGPVAFVIFTEDEGFMRVSCVWADDDPQRNGCAMLTAIPQMQETARERGLNGLVIETKHYKLARFLHRVFDARKVGNDYFLKPKETLCAAQVQR